MSLASALPMVGSGGDEAGHDVSDGVVVVDPNDLDHPLVIGIEAVERLTGDRAEQPIVRNCRLLHGEEPVATNRERLPESIEAGVGIDCRRRSSARRRR